MVKCLAQGHKCRYRESNPHSGFLTTPELESGALDRSATTLHYVPIRLFVHAAFSEAIIFLKISGFHSQFDPSFQVSCPLPECFIS